MSKRHKRLFLRRLYRYYFRFDILFKVMCLCWSLLLRPTLNPRSALCFVFLPCTRALHMRKEEGFISRRISLITSDSAMPNCSRMASKGVRSSHAISMMRSMLLWSKPGLFGELCSFENVWSFICTKNPIYLKKFVPFANDRLHGAKNGRKIGTK